MGRSDDAPNRHIMPGTGTISLTPPVRRVPCSARLCCSGVLVATNRTFGPNRLADGFGRIRFLDRMRPANATYLER